MRRTLVSILALARAYEVYENEYANDVLPGGRGDDDLPNLPYAVDANRYSDGVSSVSPLTDTAPAFPLHRGAVSDAPAGRRRLALAKVQSEIEQGVAAAGDGEYVRERRVAETLERLAANPGAAPATSFWVNASLRWNPSGFAIQSNETYRIEVRGCVEINQCVGCTRRFFTKSFLGDDVAVLARSSGEEPASPRHRAGVASMAWRTTR